MGVCTSHSRISRDVYHPVILNIKDSFATSRLTQTTADIHASQTIAGVKVQASQFQPKNQISKKKPRSFIVRTSAGIDYTVPQLDSIDNSSLLTRRANLISKKEKNPIKIFASKVLHSRVLSSRVL